MTPRYTQALLLAAEAHEGQTRKGSKIPYITHPVAVAALVARYGGDEDQQIGALFHDVLEDCGIDWETAIRSFGERVYTIVQDCTDGVRDPVTGLRASWRARKEFYLAHLPQLSDDSLLVSACDKLHNLEAIRADLFELGPVVFDRFSVSQSKTLWYYHEVSRIFIQRACPPAGEIIWTLDAIEQRLGHGG